MFSQGNVWQGGIHGSGAMCGRGANVAGGQTWQGGKRGRGANVAGGQTWQGGKRGRGHVWPPLQRGYPSYRNAFLFDIVLILFVDCPPGYYIDNTNGNACKECAMNTYNNDTDVVQCPICAGGQTTNGKTGQLACGKCTPGEVF